MTNKNKPSLESLAKQHQSSYKQNITSILKAGLVIKGSIEQEMYLHTTHDDIGLNFQDYDNPEIAAYTCYVVVKELSQEDKSYFLPFSLVTSIYKHIAATITPEKYKEEEALTELTERLNSLYFYPRDRVGGFLNFELIDKDHIKMDLYDARSGSTRNRFNHIVMYHGKFARFTLTERSEIKLTINIPTKEELEANQAMKEDFIGLKGNFRLQQIQQTLLDYGYIDKIVTEAEYVSNQKEKRRLRFEETDRMEEEERKVMTDEAILGQLEINDKLKDGGDTIPTSNIFGMLGPKESVIKVK